MSPIQGSSTSYKDAALRPENSHQAYLNSRRMALLEQVELTGSISRAAKLLGLSYTSAWDAVDAMNNLSQRPLVVCSAGQEGGTRLTDFGREAVFAWRRMQIEYERYRTRVAQGIEHFADIDRLLQAISLKTSAGNQFRGRIKSIECGAINSTLTLDLGHGLEIVATLTRESVEEMQLSPGGDALALIKSSFVLLSPDPQIRISARNRLHGKLAAIIPGPISSEVKLQLPGERTLTAMVTNESIAELGLASGQPCTALVKASHVIIAV